MLQLKQELEQEASRSLQASSSIGAEGSPSLQRQLPSISGTHDGWLQATHHGGWPQATLNNYNEDPLDDVEAVLAATADLLARTKVQSSPRFG
jgi:hypothetical protein